MKTDIFIRIIDSRNQKLQEILVGEILVAKKNFDVFVKYRKYSIQKVNKQPQLLFNHSIWNYLIHMKCEEKLETDLAKRCLFMSPSQFYSCFYTKKEIRKLKLNLLMKNYEN